MADRSLELFIKKNCNRQIKKKKRNTLYVKWKGYYNSFNSCINKKDLV